MVETISLEIDKCKSKNAASKSDISGKGGHLFDVSSFLFVGCPKNEDNGKECSDHGDCDSVTHECSCDEAWTGVACHLPNCPGNGNCFGRGFCNPDYDTPVCEDCETGWMGPDCNTPCVHGTQVCTNFNPFLSVNTLKYATEISKS